MALSSGLAGLVLVWRMLLHTLIKRYNLLYRLLHTYFHLYDIHILEEEVWEVLVWEGPGETKNS